MTLPERDTPELAIAEERINRLLRALAYFGSHKVPESSVFRLLMRDEESEVLVTIAASGQHTDVNGVMVSEIPFYAPLITFPTEATVLDTANIQIKAEPGSPMICFSELLGEFPEGSIVQVSEGHHQFTSESGKLDVFSAPKQVIAVI